MVQFASRMDLLKGSEIRELLKLTAQPDILSFAGGMPAPELFPVEQMMEASIAVLKEHGREALQYSTTEGFPRLREQIAERMLAKNNIHTDKDHILVTSGSQQGLDFSARVFLNPVTSCCWRAPPTWAPSMRSRPVSPSSSKFPPMTAA